jgi:hypothetical protein
MFGKKRIIKRYLAEKTWNCILGLTVSLTTL